MHENAGHGRTRHIRGAVIAGAVTAFLAATAAIAAEGPAAVTSDGRVDGRASLKRDGGSWYEIWRGPAGLVRRPFAAPPRSDAVVRLGATTSLFGPYVAYPTNHGPAVASAASPAIA
jgi:hypothetical protein